MAIKVPQRVKSFLESSDWGAPDGTTRPSPGASHASGRRNAGEAYRPNVELSAPIPSLHDDPEFAEIDARYLELQAEFNRLDAQVDRLLGDASAQARLEGEYRVAEASALTSRPITGVARPATGVADIFASVDALRARRDLVRRALEQQTRLRNDAWNRASKAAIEKARPHHQALVLRATEAAVALSRRLEELHDYTYALAQKQIFVSELRDLTPPGEGGGVGRMGNQWSPIREHLRRLQKARYPVPNVPESADDPRIAS